ncbi:hypothetical protein [Fusobacterium sp. PH5-44]|uniref:hypothetical protein n=1 Tax=unclassified Fusobacterium TaxID=2648384 RepID=UPI003D1D456A
MSFIDNKIPILRRGNIIDSNILNNMQDTPHEYLGLHYSNYCNGVLYGVDVYGKDYSLIVGKGIIKWNNFYYRITEEVSTEIPYEDGDYIFKMRFLPPKSIESEKYTLYQMEIFHTFDDTKNENEMELMRIKRREGAIIRNVEKFSGINAEYNLINEITKPQSTSTGESFPESLLRLFAQEVLEKKEYADFDGIYCHSIMNGPITRESLKQYIRYKMRKNIDMEVGNEYIYEQLVKILKSMRDSYYREEERIRENNILIVE